MADTLAWLGLLITGQVIAWCIGWEMGKKLHRRGKRHND